MDDYNITLPGDTVIPELRDFDGNPMTLDTYAEYAERGWRVYDADCLFIMSHTKHWCGYSRCSDG